MINVMTFTWKWLRRWFRQETHVQNCHYIYVTTYMSERALSITFTEDWRSEMVWTLLPVSGSHNWQIRLRKIKFELRTQELHINDFSVSVGAFALSTGVRIHWDSGPKRLWWARCAMWVHYYRWRWLWLLFAGNGPSAPAASPRSNSREGEKSN